MYNKKHSNHAVQQVTDATLRGHMLGFRSGEKENCHDGRTNQQTSSFRLTAQQRLMPTLQLTVEEHATSGKFMVNWREASVFATTWLCKSMRAQSVSIWDGLFESPHTGTGAGVACGIALPRWRQELEPPLPIQQRFEFGRFPSDASVTERSAVRISVCCSSGAGHDRQTPNNRDTLADLANESTVQVLPPRQPSIVCRDPNNLSP